MSANRYCHSLGIDVPKLETTLASRDASAYSLLIAALLERGGAMTLIEVAERFEEAGVAPAEDALRSLKRCRPARAPVYRDGDDYHLDLQDDELDLWAFRLGLKPANFPRLRVVRPEPEPLPGPESALGTAELEEMCRSAPPSGWSVQRYALAILDTHGTSMTPEAVRARAAALGIRVRFTGEAVRWNKVAAVRENKAGRWELVPGHPHLHSARQAVRKRLEQARQGAADRPDPAAQAARNRVYEQRRAAHAAELAALRRAVLHVFPGKEFQAAALVDLAERRIDTFMKAQLEELRERLGGYDVVAAIDCRASLRQLGLDVDAFRFAELGPPQKTRKLNRAGRTLKITTKLLVQSTCGISRPFGDPKKLRDYLQKGQTTKFQRRLEADAKALASLYAYGRLHGAVRLRWGFLDELLPAPWRHHDEQGLHGLMQQAHEQSRSIEVVTGTAPGWSEPWARGRRCTVARDPRGYGFELVDEDGILVEEFDVQAARLR